MWNAAWAREILMHSKFFQAVNLFPCYLPPDNCSGALREQKSTFGGGGWGVSLFVTSQLRMLRVSQKKQPLGGLGT